MGKAAAIPYCTVKAFRACVEILKVAPPALIDRDSLVERGLSPHAVYPVLGALRFLVIVDEDGQLTQNVTAFLDEGDLAGRRQVFEQAYAGLLRDVTFPIDEREDVDRLLIERHDVATGVAAFCATFFLWLAAESGIPVSEIRRSRRGRPPAHLAQLSDAAQASLRGHATGDRADLAAFVGPESPENGSPEVAPRSVPQARPAL